MRFTEITESTVAGAISTVALPMGETQKRTKPVKVAGLTPADGVMFGKTKKKGPYQNSLNESKMKDLAMDLRNDKDGLSNAEFKKKYGKTKEEMRKSLKDKKVNEAELSEDDLIILPSQGRRFKTGFIPKSQDRTDHEVEMAMSDLYHSAKNAKQVYDMLKSVSEEQGLEGWVQEKIVKANDYLNTVREYLEHKLMKEGMPLQGGVIAAGGVGEGVVEGAKVDRMVQHIKKSEIKSGKSAEKAEDIAWATVNKRGYLDNKNKKKDK